MGKKERQRKLARERMLRQQARRAERARRSRQITMISVVCLVVVGLGVGGFFLFSQPGTTSNAAASATASASPSSTAARHADAVTHPGAGRGAGQDVQLPDRPAPPPARSASRPPGPTGRPATRPPSTPTAGDVVIDLLNSKATCTVNSFVYLAGQKYFNNTHCHRLTTVSPLYVLQCGDPTGTGSGGPGYKFNDENLAGANYTAGTVAMANAGADTNGSQFFLVYKNSTLSPNYTPFGRSSKDSGSSRMWPRRAATTPMAPGMGTRRRKSKSRASLLRRPEPGDAVWSRAGQEVSGELPPTIRGAG